MEENQNTIVGVDRKTSEKEFDRFVEAMNIDMELIMMDENERGEARQSRERMIRAIEKGKMVVNEDGCAVCVGLGFRDADLIFYKPKGAELLAMDRKKEHQTVGKMYSLLGAVTRTSDSLFAKMDYEDVKLCQAVVGFFM